MNQQTIDLDKRVREKALKKGELEGIVNERTNKPVLYKIANHAMNMVKDGSLKLHLDLDCTDINPSDEFCFTKYDEEAMEFCKSILAKTGMKATTEFTVNLVLYCYTETK